MEDEKTDRTKDLGLKLLLVSIFVIFLGLTIFVLFSHSAKATDVSGHITSDMTWNISGNPYIVKGDIFIDEGATLIIEPGAEIKFDGYYSFYVDGYLSAKGNTTSEITFTSNDLNPAVADWRCIHIREQGGAYFNYCKISYCYYGIFIDRSKKTTVVNTSIFEASQEGIYIKYSPGTTIANTTISACNQGINLYRSSNMSLSSAQFWNISTRVLVVSTDYSADKRYYNHSIVDCKVNGGIIYYYFDIDDVTIEGLEAGEIILAWVDNITLNNCNVTNGDGICISYSSNSTITNCNISNNYMGILLHYSPLDIGENNSNYNTITHNTIYNNTFGINLYYSDDNLITDNDIVSNGHGIYSYFSGNNWIYHNNFIGNDNQVYQTGSSRYHLNYWDNGNEGNYWSDHYGKDDEGDGISDGSYYISSNNKDNYPLMAPWEGSLPRDTKPPRIGRTSVSYGIPMILPRDSWRLEFTANEQVHYEVIIDTDGTKGFDNSTDTVLRSHTIAKSHLIFWNGSGSDDEYVEDGDYQIQVMIWDRAGNPMNAPKEYSVSTLKDLDLDGVIDAEDIFPYDPTESEDFDGDGIGDNSDDDWDNDDVPNHDDAFPWDGEEWSDSDDDGIGDNADEDDNNNGIQDIVEIPLVIVIFLIPIVTLYLTNRYVKAKKKKEE